MLERHNASFDLMNLKQVLTTFYYDIGQEYDEYDIRNRSYHPSIDRWNIERLWKKQDKNVAEFYGSEIIQNLRTNLMERYHVVESRGKFIINNGKIYSEFFPDEPFSSIIRRGVEYRKQMGSNEQQREQAELDGWLKIEKFLTDKDTPSGSKVILFSPPGSAADTIYKMKFVDVFTLIENEDTRYVKRERFSVDYDTEKYKEKIKEISPDFNFSSTPMFDEACINQPIYLSPGHKLNILLAEKGMSAEKFEQLFSLPHSRLNSFFDYYVDKLYDRVVDWKNVVLAFNAIVNHCDDLVNNSAADNIIFGNKNTLADHDEILNLGSRPVREIVGGGCPPNKGFSIKNSLFGNSVGQFGVNETGWEYHIGECLNCHSKPVEVGPCNICKECEKVL